MDLQSEYLDALIRVVDKYGLSELEVEYKGINVRLRKNSASIHSTVSAPVQVPLSASMLADESAKPALVKNGASVASSGRGLNIQEVKSPLAGLFYRASSPDSDPFVEAGDPVEVNQVLCIVEAMKVFNEINSETSGIIREILPKNGEEVSEGQVLFLIERGGQ